MKHTVWITFLLFALTSCTESHRGQNDPSILSKIPEINLIHAPDQAIVSAGIQQTFTKHLSHNLYCHKGFRNGSEVAVEYRFIRFTQGSRLLGTLGGGLGPAGKGTLCVEATFKSAHNQVLGQVQSNARFGNTLLGDAIDEALKEAAEEIASYANSLFKPLT